MNETPILRVLVGNDPMATENGQVDAPAYLHIQLRWDATRAAFLSEAAGRPIFQKVLILRHIYPGTTDTLDVAVKVYPDDGPAVVLDERRAEMFREVIAKFEANADQAASGTPLVTMNLDPAQVATLQASGVQSVEALADVPDSALERLGMGARVMRERARAFFAALEGNAPTAALQAENERLKADLDQQRADMAEVKAEMAANRAAAKAAKASAS